MTPNNRSVPSSASSRRLVRPTRQSKNAVEPALADLYDMATAINRDDNTAGSRGLGRATPCILEHSNSALLSEPPKVTISPELRAEIFALKHWRGLLQTAFLSGDKNPKEDIMQAISGHLYYMEDSTDLQSDMIRETKIRRALIEVLKLGIVPGESKFQFKSRLQRLLDRCNKVLESEKIMAENREKSADGNSYSTIEQKGSTLDTRTISNTSSLSLKANSQPKRKRHIGDHVTEENKRVRKASTVIAIDSGDEDKSPHDSFQDQSHQSDTSEYRILHNAATRQRRTQRKSVIDKEEFRKQVEQDFKWIDDTKILVRDARELVEALLPILKKQEEQVFEQTVKVKALSLQLNSINDFLNDCGAQEEKITMRWQNR